MTQYAQLLIPFADLAIQVAGAGLLGLGSFAAKRAADWLKLSADDKVRGYLTEAMERAIDWAQDEARKRLPEIQDHAAGDGILHDTAENVVGFAVTYMRERVPDGLKRLGVSDTGLEAMIRARLARG